jgi:hypothetical protein
METYILKNHGDMWSRWEHYDNTKSVYNQLNECKMLKEWLDYLETNCIFNEPGFNNVDAVHHAHDLKVVICHKSFKATVEESMSALIFYEALKLTVPVQEGPLREQSPWLFKGSLSDKRIGFLNAPMGGSVVYNKTKQKKASAKVPKKGTASASSMLNHQEVMDAEFEDGTAKVWLHDLVQCLQSPAQMLHEAGGEPRAVVLKDSMRRCIRIALHLCFTGTVVMNGKDLKASSGYHRGPELKVLTCAMSLETPWATSDKPTICRRGVRQTALIVGSSCASIPISIGFPWASQQIPRMRTLLSRP